MPTFADVPLPLKHYSNDSQLAVWGGSMDSVSLLLLKPCEAARLLSFSERTLWSLNEV